MSLDITFKEMRPMLCQHCGKLVTMETVDCVVGGGREWYDILESIGYYVPYDQRTEENDWYGKDMTLTHEQAQKVYQYIKKHPNIYGYEASGLIASALMDGNTVVVNADW